MTKKSNIQGAIGCFIALMLFIGLVFGTKLVLETNARLDSAELNQERLETVITTKSIEIVDLKELLEYQDILNASFNGRIHSNYLNIDRNQEEIIQTWIEVDRFMMLIDEIMEELDRR